MNTGSHALFRARLTSDNVGTHLETIMRMTGIPLYFLAMGAGIQESHLVRTKSNKHAARAETLKPIERVERLIAETFGTLTDKGAKKWLVEPNPYLNDVAPIMCVRSDKELERVLSLLAAVKHGFPA